MPACLKLTGITRQVSQRFDLKKQKLPYYLSRSTGSQQWFSAAVCTALGEEVITMNKTVKTWRIFLLGMCCILACLYLKRILCSFEIIKGDFLSDRIVLLAVIWFIAGIFRLYKLNQIYPKDKTVFSKDKWCIAEAVIVFILAIGLT